MPDRLGPVQAVASGNNLYLLWEQDTYGMIYNSGNHTIYFKKSSDGGKTFGDTVLLNISASECSTGAQMVVSRNPNTNMDNIYVLWSDNNEMLFKGSNDGGATFGKTIALGNGFLGDGGAVSSLGFNAAIVADSNNGVYVVWTASDQNSRDIDMFFTASSNGGNIFGNLTKFSSLNVDYQDAQVAADSQHVYLVWSEDTGCQNIVQLSQCKTKIMFAKSYDKGESFGSPEVLAAGNSTASDLIGNSTGSNNAKCFSLYCGLPSRPEVFVNGTDLYLTWMYDTNTIYFVHSADNGQTLSLPANLTTSFIADGSQSQIFSPYVMAFDNSIYFAGEVNNGTTTSVYILKSQDNGNHFQRIVSAIPSGFEFLEYRSPQFQIARGGEFYFTWLPSPPSKTILFEAVQENQSAAAINPITIYSNPAGAYLESSPILAAASGTGDVYVMWINETQGIIIRSSSDGGMSFGSPTVIHQEVVIPEFSSTILEIALASVLLSAVIATRSLTNRFQSRSKS